MTDFKHLTFKFKTSTSDIQYGVEYWREVPLSTVPVRYVLPIGSLVANQPKGIHQWILTAGGVVCFLSRIGRHRRQVGRGWRLSFFLGITPVRRKLSGSRSVEIISVEIARVWVLELKISGRLTDSAMYKRLSLSSLRPHYYLILCCVFGFLIIMIAI